MALVTREMGRNHDASLPERKSKSIFSGKVEKVQVLECQGRGRFDMPRYQIEVEMRMEGGAVAIVRINSGTQFWDEVRDKFFNEEAKNQNRALPHDMAEAVKTQASSA